MIKNVFFIAFFLVSSLIFSQKPQRIAYIDMDYILENIPEYSEAQSRLDQKVKDWKQKLDNLTDEINTLKADLENEKALLTNEMIKEREEDIDIKVKELNRLQLAYFGPEGDLYRLRKQFVKPVQDQVFNSIQTIAERKKYDFVFDKSSDLIMLYYNRKFDISELVLNSIVKNRKKKIIEDRKSQRNVKGKKAPIEQVTEAEAVEQDVDDAISEETDATDPDVIKEQEALKKQQEKEAKRAALKARIKEQQEARERLRDSLKRESERRREEKLKEIEKRKKEREQLINKDN
jgi:Skp family chaperone for outer membrane proteins